MSASCPYCGGADTEALYSGVKDRLGFVPGERSFSRCRQCGSAVLDPPPEASELAGFYPPVYSFTPTVGTGSLLKRLVGRAEHALYFRPQYRAQARRAARACGWATGRGRRLLDVGCGRGLRLVEFRRLGFDVHGLDVVPEVVRYLRDELTIPAVCGDAAEIAAHYPPASFDLVTAYQLIEHVPDVSAFLRGAANALKPGGWVATATPLRDSLQAAAFGRRWINATEAPRHVSLATQDGLRAALGRAGFTDIRILPDALLNCAGLVGLSALPGAALTHAYGGGRLRPLAIRAAAGLVAAAAVPFCAAENYLLGRPAVGVAVARKPE